jgi:hypothetical protein
LSKFPAANLKVNEVALVENVVIPATVPEGLSTNGVADVALVPIFEAIAPLISEI